MIDPEPIVEAKRRARDAARARRSALSAETRAEGARRIAERGLAGLEIAKPSVVSGFMAIGEEIDPAPLMAELQRQGHSLALPVMVGKGKPLIFRRWRPGEPLVERLWGIREPGPSAAEVRPDVLLVPLLAFDRCGRRLGYGGGFYDRTLARLRASTTILAVGLAFACQEVDAVPALDYDERLDWILTPDGPIRANP